jgi:hypothetical protein
MMTLEDAQKRIGQRIKSDHPYAYRSGQWATIVGATQTDDLILWSLLWPDGERDDWAVDDSAAYYEFSDMFEVDRQLRLMTLAMKQITLTIHEDELTPGIRAPRELRAKLTKILTDWSEASDA